MDITFMNQTGDQSFKGFERYLKPLLIKTLKKTNFDIEANVSIVIMDDAAIQEFNKTYRNIDRATDVLSFVDGDVFDGVVSLGDILISSETCKRQAEKYGHSLKREFLFLVTHGYLHLLGYDHISEEDEKQMFKLQKEILDDIVKKSDA